MKYAAPIISFLIFSAVFVSFNINAIEFNHNFDACPECNIKYPSANYKISGSFVDIDHHKIWVEQYGKGSPAVIFLNGGGDTIRQWNNIIPVISKHTTVVAYDRQGLGESELSNLKPRTAKELEK